LFRILDRLVRYKIRQLKNINATGSHQEDLTEESPLSRLMQRENSYVNSSTIKKPRGAFEVAMWEYYQVLEKILLDTFKEKQQKIKEEIDLAQVKRRLR